MSDRIRTPKKAPITTSRIVMVHMAESAYATLIDVARGAKQTPSDWAKMRLMEAMSQTPGKGPKSRQPGKVSRTANCDQVRMAFEMKHQGKNLAEIAASCGLSPSVCRSFFEAAGV